MQIAAIVGVHIFEGADLVGRHRADDIHILVVFRAGLGIAAQQSVQTEEEVILPELVLEEQFAVELLLDADEVRHQAILHELHTLMLDVVVRGTLQVGDHMRRDTVDSGDLGLLELARSDELGIFGRDGDAFVGHTALQQQWDVGIVQTDRLGDKVFLEPLVGFGLECRGIFEDARHIAVLIEEAFAVELSRDGECEVVAMDGDRTFVLIAVGREPAQVDDVFVREQFARVRSVEEFVVVGKDWFDTGRMNELQPNGTVAFVPKYAGIAVASQSARDHQMVHQVETCGIGVGSLHESVAEMVVLPFTTACSTAIEVQRERSDRFGEDSHASPNRCKVQCTLLGDIWLVRGIGDRVGGNDFIHRRLEFGR